MQLTENDNYIQNPYLYIANACNLSERTIRNAFNRQPITYGTAAKIAKNFNIPVRCFRCIEDRRGRPKKK